MKLEIRDVKRVADDGEFVVEKQFWVDGIRVTEEEAHELVPDGDSSEVGIGMLPASSCNAWPIYSDGFAVHPTQVAQAEEHCKSLGVPCEFTRDGTGRAIFTSQQHQRDVLKAHYMVNRSDVAGGQSRTVKRPSILREDYV